MAKTTIFLSRGPNIPASLGVRKIDTTAPQNKGLVRYTTIYLSVNPKIPLSIFQGNKNIRNFSLEWNLPKNLILDRALLYVINPPRWGHLVFSIFCKIMHDDTLYRRNTLKIRHIQYMILFKIDICEWKVCRIVFNNKWALSTYIFTFMNELTLNLMSFYNTKNLASNRTEQHWYTTVLHKLSISLTNLHIFQWLQNIANKIWQAVKIYQFCLEISVEIQGVQKTICCNFTPKH